MFGGAPSEERQALGLHIGNVIEMKTGELVTLNFQKAYATNSRIQLTPVNAASAGLQYFASQGVKFFTIQTAGIPTPDTTYVFNYFVTQ